MEAMKNLTEAEIQAVAMRDTAIVQGRERLVELQRVGAKMLAQSRVDAQTEVDAMMASAEAEAKTITATILDEAAAECNTMQQTARGRLQNAATLIAERVVNY